MYALSIVVCCYGASSAGLAMLLAAAQRHGWLP
jgi:hypothetical protein